MAGQIVQMDYPVVKSTAQGFRQQSDTVLTIGKVAVALFSALELSNMFFNPGLAAYYGRCKNAVNKKSKELSDTLLEFAADLDQAVQDHVKGDTEGKRYFGK